MTTQAELMAFLQDMDDSDFMIGVLDHLYSKKFSNCENYSQEGVVESRMAILLNNLGYIFPFSFWGEDDYLFVLGRVEVENYLGIADIPSLGDNLIGMYEDALDEWEEIEEGEPLEYSFTMFQWSKVSQAAASGKRVDIYPILNHFMKIFMQLNDYFIEYRDGVMFFNFEADVITDETLEQAFISFVEFVNTVVIPKISIQEDVSANS
ncbi:hypothetical protein HYG89_05260 [Acinetobacter sp. SwsAc5]|uniref:hypothetical protein n=1 Tax=Acinetobacter sp. SwsAc5 TaxID=2749438 RepID=UPI0015BECFDA|nr:hypothetical protein [Acinetobacter sp. SwsAc5]NWK51976.1 hypothetical protein [Acinetobacter sp. SwsAc5]